MKLFLVETTDPEGYDDYDAYTETSIKEKFEEFCNSKSKQFVVEYVVDVDWTVAYVAYVLDEGESYFICSKEPMDVADELAWTKRNGKYVAFDAEDFVETLDDTNVCTLDDLTPVKEAK